jgi:two-component system, LytTR family, sensor kinase
MKSQVPPIDPIRAELAPVQRSSVQARPAILHPALFIPAFTMFGLLFALQEWLNMRRAGYWKTGPFVEFGAWGTQYFLWGVFWWLAWRFAGNFIRDLRLPRIITVALPLGLIVCLVEQMIWVLLVPYIPMRQGPTTYWHHVAQTFIEDLAESVAIYWFGFFFIRAIGYYQLLRAKESAASRLETELANAKLSALRMQLNPHFLFNMLNSISSLMRTDVDAADSMLEQLSSLLRMSLERGNVQLIPLHEEVEFIETYLAMQNIRYAGRVLQRLTVDPELHDALVPAMFLQPIIENAFAHGISKIDHGELSIEVHRDGQRLQARVINSGKGLGNDQEEHGRGRGVGLANVRNRLQLHYGEDSAFCIQEIDSGKVQVTISLPLQISTAPSENPTHYLVG